MNIVYHHTRKKWLLTHKGAVEMARRRGMRTLWTWFHYGNEPTSPSYENLVEIRIEMRRTVGMTEEFTAVDLGKSWFEERRNAGPAWAAFPLAMARSWAIKIALSQIFGFPLESTDGSEWPELVESIVDDLEISDCAKET